MSTTLSKEGFEIKENIYTQPEVDAILNVLHQHGIAKKFGVREILISVPELSKFIFNKNLQKEISKIAKNAFLVKSIYFDKPPQTNWIVNWHQDLTINVNKQLDLPDYKNWRTLKERTVVQPPLAILENIFTIRIHLDNCEKENGALRVIKNSHNKGVIDVRDGIEKFKSEALICEVKKGGILIMKPLILHSSKRTENNKKRRILHLEFSDKKLPTGLEWKEYLEIKLTKF